MRILTMSHLDGLRGFLLCSQAASADVHPLQSAVQKYLGPLYIRIEHAIGLGGS